MKVKLSISLDDETIKLIEQGISSQKYRNKSHAIEYAIKRLLENKIENQIQKKLDAGQKKLGVFANGRK